MPASTGERRTAPPDAAADARDVAAAAAGDVEAFERLYRRHVARVHTLARRMLGAHEADDATQEIFLRAWRKLGSYRGEAAFGTWLYRLALNLVLGRRASLSTWHGRHRTASNAVASRPAPQPRPDLRVDLEAGIERLPGGAREVFVLHDVEGYRHSEIAEMLGISSGTSKSQLHRARMLLRQHLAPGASAPPV